MTMMMMMLRICLLFLVLALTTTVAVEEEETTAKTQDAETCTNPPTTVDEVPPGHHKCKVDADGNCIDKTCEDKDERCWKWAESGECGSNSKYMLNFCKKSCNVCDHTGNLTELILLKKRLSEVDGDETLLEDKYGMKQIDQTTDEYNAVIPGIIKDMEDYMENIIFKDPKYESLKHSCKNRNKNCAYWKAKGECEVNPKFMEKQCAPACQTCHVLDPTHRCPVDKDAPVALQPGDLNKLFENIATNEHYAPLGVTVLSKPNPTEAELATIKDGPWILTMDNFMSEQECDALVQQGYNLGYKRSGDTGKKNFDGSYEKSINSGRTSTNAFCQFDCLKDPASISVTERMENVTGIPQVNYEFLQLLRYEEGQFYNAHHDYAGYHVERQFGPRIITIFLYMNEPEEGGATDFPDLGITVQPKKGKALMWPSVQDTNPLMIDYRTRHGANVVNKGVKYAANAWIHQGDFRGTYAKGCI